VTELYGRKEARKGQDIDKGKFRIRHLGDGLNARDKSTSHLPMPRGGGKKVSRGGGRLMRSGVGILTRMGRAFLGLGPSSAVQGDRGKRRTLAKSDENKVRPTSSLLVGQKRRSILSLGGS